MEFNQKTFHKLLWSAAFVVLIAWALQNYQLLLDLLGTVLGLLAPFLIGLAMAFILNVPMRVMERLLFAPRAGKHEKLRQGLKRPVSILLTLIFVSGIIFIVLFLVLPELGRTMGSLRNQIPAFMNWAQQISNRLVVALPELREQILSLQFDWDAIGKSMFSFLQNGATSLVNSTFSIATSVFSGVFNFALGLVFCIYALAQKEKLARQVKKLLYGWLPEASADRVVEVSSLSSKTFSNFITGQCLEAVILGSMFFVCMLLFRFPYALMISVLIAFTALIPVFGAFIGCIVGAFMILVSDPSRVLWFLLLFLILQQLEGNLIYPRVVGTSVGLPAMWVLLAVTLGGSTLGVLGMLISVPLCSVVYALLRDAAGERLRARRIAPEKLQ